jgi:hypothetical protein
MGALGAGEELGIAAIPVFGAGVVAIPSGLPPTMVKLKTLIFIFFRFWPCSSVHLSDLILPST